jgi:outer membrane protein TolC
MTRSALAMLDDRAAELERRVKTSRTMLERWTGVEDDRRTLGEAPDIGALRDTRHTLEALANHPEIEVLARQEQVASAEARLASANKRPDWSVELAYGRRSPAFDDMVSIGVSIPLAWDQPNRQDREVAAKLAAAAQAGAQREEALRRHVAEVRVMAAEWESNRSRLVRYEREIVPLATARAEAAFAAYRGGKSAVSDVLAARRGELEAKLQALQLSAETARLWAQLSYLFPEETQ